MAAVASNETMRSLLDNPRLTRDDAANLMIRACGDDIGEGAVNLLKMLAENGRLDQLPMIDVLFRQFRDDAEGTVKAEVLSAQPPEIRHRRCVETAPWPRRTTELFRERRPGGWCSDPRRRPGD